LEQFEVKIPMILLAVNFEDFWKDIYIEILYSGVRYNELNCFQNLVRYTICLF